MSKKINNLSTDELYILIGRNVARLRNEANLSQLELSLEMGNKSSSLVLQLNFMQIKENLILHNYIK